LLPLLAGGSPFAVFANSAQPLAEAADSLLRAKSAVCMDLHEPWSREHQVLPQRTHPMMNMSATGGYVLVGFKVFP
jgi:tRNA (adenine-N(1)-)-methyltransferase non-catalytic subunit